MHLIETLPGRYINPDHVVYVYLKGSRLELTMLNGNVLTYDDEDCYRIVQQFSKLGVEIKSAPVLSRRASISVEEFLRDNYELKIRMGLCVVYYEADDRHYMVSWLVRTVVPGMYRAYLADRTSTLISEDTKLHINWSN